MFVCKKCLEENYKNIFLGSSHGPCEECGKSLLCADIKSSQLISKEKPDTKKHAPTIKSFIGQKASYDDLGQFIWGVDKDGHHQKLADLRGWGAIQNLFRNTDGTIDLDAAGKFQEQLGEWIVDAINQKLKKEAL